MVEVRVEKVGTMSEEKVVVRGMVEAGRKWRSWGEDVEWSQG